MSALDWLVFAAYLAVLMVIGARVARAAGASEEYFVARRSMPWWAVGLSVMATQASAITFIGTTGKGYEDGLRFAQFYLGMPVAMVILGFTLVPAYHRAQVFTAYEFLGRRFDRKTRTLTAVLFLLSRGLALGVVVYAPSVVLAMLLGWSLPFTVTLVVVVAMAYTAVGGLRAVIWTDVLQMALVTVGLVAVFLAMLERLPADVGLGAGLELADALGRLQVIDLSLDPSDRYTLWSGLLGGTFLFLAYFGCDQSQVQRLLATRSVGQTRRALLLNAVLKVPLQLWILFLGVTLFVVLTFEAPPLLFDPGQEAAVAEEEAWPELQARYRAAHADRAEAARAFLELPGGPAGGELRARRARFLEAEAALGAVRGEAAALVTAVTGRPHDDTNAVFPWFVIRTLPVGLVGLLIAAVFAAAMSSMDSELNALATTTVVDVLDPWLGEGDRPRVIASRVATVAWGLLASAFAYFAGALGSVIEAVNIVGSYFYGSLLGVFVLVAIPLATGTGACVGLLAGMGAVAWASTYDVAWLWLNPVGALTVVVVGCAVSLVTRGRQPT